MASNRITLTRRTALALAAAAGRPHASAWQSFYWGKDEPLPRQIPLAAGPLTMVFEPELGFLRYLRYEGVEVIRGIYAAVRDRNWGTVAPRLSNLRMETGDASFRVTFDLSCQQGPIDFLWTGRMEGEPSGRVHFRMEGEARTTFLRNRIGFCVLHPVQGCAGEWCTVLHSDGSKEQGKFPLLVSPHQPFLDIAAISHRVTAQVTATVRFAGDTFEMEDHRNWTDASFKTYCTPLAKPFPVEVKKGERITQSVTVDLEGVPAAARRSFSPPRRPVRVSVPSGGALAVPALGLGFSGMSPSLALLRPAHLRVDLDGAGQVPAGLPLEVALHLEGDGGAQLEKASRLRARVVRWLVYHNDEKAVSGKWLERARSALKGAAIGGGTNAYFAELNRARPDPAPFDFLCYSINPQVHAFDNASLVENLAAQADTVASAKAFAGGKGIVITPVTLLPRFNPNATEALRGAPPADPRQSSLFAAAWTVGSIKYLSESGVQAVTYYETLGPRGIASADTVFPVYHVLADVLAFGPVAKVRPCRSSEPLAVEALLLEQGAQRRMLLANLSPEVQVVRLLWSGAAARIRKLDDHSHSAASKDPQHWRIASRQTVQPAGSHLEVALSAYAIATIDG